MKCWKVLSHNDEGLLLSVVRGMKYELGSLYNEECEPQVEVVETTNGKSRYKVYGGYMHAFTSRKAAKLGLDYYSYAILPNGMKLVICRCTIPAGTEVYTNEVCEEICARKLIIDKILKL